MKQEYALALLEKAGAIVNGHFVLTSGLHSGQYVNKDAAYPDTDATHELCTNMVLPFAHDANIGAIIAPATGGINLIQGATEHLKLLTGNPHIAAIYAEPDDQSVLKAKDNDVIAQLRLSANELRDITLHKGESIFIRRDRLVIGRGYNKHILGRRVLLLDDILTTGGSLRKLADVVRREGGEPIGASVLCNRGATRAIDLGLPQLHALLQIIIMTWAENECPLCQEGVPINTDLGKGKDFLARKALHAG